MGTCALDIQKRGQWVLQVTVQWGGGVLTSLVNRKVCVSSGKLVLSPSSGPRLGQDQGRNLETRVVWKGSNQGEDGAVWGCSHGPFCSNT